MIDGIDYFPKRDRYKKKKKGAEDDWNALKKIKTAGSSPKPEGLKTRKNPSNKE
ncbi:MAG: hypothetical protein HY579_08650 [Nitrospinae bacterium]|nr:hypothetical protein [Nitrospinota bacterium]